MIEWSVHKNWLNSQAKLLPEWHRVIFGAACGERALPSYKAYAAYARDRSVGISEVASLQSVIEFIWASVEATSVDQTQAEDHLRTLEGIAERREVSPPAWTRWQTHALDTTYVVMCVLRTLVSKDVDEIITASTVLYDTVSYFMQAELAQGNPFTGRQADSDQTVQIELERQQRDVLFLLDHRRDDPRLLFRGFRIRSQNEKALPMCEGSK